MSMSLPGIHIENEMLPDGSGRIVRTYSLGKLISVSRQLWAAPAAATATERAQISLIGYGRFIEQQQKQKKRADDNRGRDTTSGDNGEGSQPIKVGPITPITPVKIGPIKKIP